MGLYSTRPDILMIDLLSPSAPHSAHWGTLNILRKGDRQNIPPRMASRSAAGCPTVTRRNEDMEEKAAWRID